MHALHRSAQAAAIALCVVGPGLAPAPAAAAPTEPDTLVNPLDDPTSCQGCHAFGNPAAQADEPPYAPFHWQGSLMANAARDPVFWAGVAIASQDDPPDTVECIRCHSPNAFLQGRGDAIAMDELQGADLAGVLCDACHRQMDDGMTPPGNARYVIDDTVVGSAVPKRGPWTYAGPPMPPHAWMQDNFVGSARMCGTCHDVTTPRERVDDAGIGMGMSFNEQRTYSEWQNSEFALPGPAARSCQDCHMPAVSDISACAMLASQQLHPTGGRRHDLVGANRVVTELLRDLYGDGGDGSVQSIWFDRALDRMDELLATAATLEVVAPASVNVQDGLELQVTVTNESGHKLPTGYSEGRVAWLEVVASYGGQVLWSSGEWQPGEGPDEQDPRLRTYRAIAEDFDDKAVFHLLRNNHWVEDTRIPPRGLAPDVETDPVTDRYTLQMDGTWPNFDVVDYAFDPAVVEDITPMDATDDVLQIDVRLLYLINTNAYLDFLATENQTNGAGTFVQALFDDKGGAEPVTLASWSTTVPLAGLDTPGGSSGSAGSSGSTGQASGDVSGSSASGSGTASTEGATGTASSAGSNAGGDGCACRTTGGRGAPGPAPFLLTILLPTLLRPRRDRSPRIGR